MIQILFLTSYSKFSEKNTFSASLSLTDTNTRRSADTISRSLNLNNNYSLSKKHKISSGIVVSDSRGNQNQSNSTKKESNTLKQGFSMGYQYLFGNQNSLSLKYALNETEAIADYNGLTDQAITLSYSKNFLIGNLGLSYTKTDKEYNQVDTFVHPTIVRDDNVENYSISLNGSLGQISNSLNFINLPERI